jgi:hypothetical protein
MAPMRACEETHGPGRRRPEPARRRWALLFLLAAACNEEPKKHVRPPEPLPIAFRTDFATTQPPGWDIEIRIPKDWTRNYKMVNEHEVEFAGAGTPGEMPEMDIGWKASDRDLETHARETFRRYENPAYRILGRGNATIAGMPARYLVFETGKMRKIEYCFAGHGYIGYIRGIATIDEFAKWGPVFEEAARRTRYNPK